MHRIRSFSAFFVLLGLLCATVGCGSGGSEGVPVVGVVTYNGAPVAGADVAFSLEGDAPSVGAFGRTNDNGRFELSSPQIDGGIPPGNYLVKVSKMSVETSWSPGQDEGVRPEQIETVGLPAKYAEYKTSGLTAVVEDGQTNEFVFDLTD